MIRIVFDAGYALFIRAISRQSGHQLSNFHLTVNGLLSDLQESTAEPHEANQILQFLWLFIVSATFLN